MSDEFDTLVAGMYGDDYRHLDTEDAIHLFGAVGFLTAMLGAWEVEDAALAQDPEYAALRASTKAQLNERMSQGYASAVKLADEMGEAAQRYAARLSEWVAARLPGPVFLYVLLPCCGQMIPVVMGDGKPARFFDPEKDTLPVRGGTNPGIEPPGN